MKMSFLIVIGLLTAPSAFAFGKRSTKLPEPPTPIQLGSDSSITVQCLINVKGSNESSTNKTIPRVISLTNLPLVATVISGSLALIDESTQIQLSVYQATSQEYEVVLSRTNNDEEDCNLGQTTSDQFVFSDESSTKATLSSKDGRLYALPGSIAYAYTAKKIALNNKCGFSASPSAPVGSEAITKIECSLR